MNLNLARLAGFDGPPSRSRSGTPSRGTGQPIEWRTSLVVGVERERHGAHRLRHPVGVREGGALGPKLFDQRGGAAAPSQMITLTELNRMVEGRTGGDQLKHRRDVAEEREPLLLYQPKHLVGVELFLKDDVPPGTSVSQLMSPTHPM